MQSAISSSCAARPVRIPLVFAIVCLPLLSACPLQEGAPRPPDGLRDGSSRRAHCSLPPPRDAGPASDAGDTALPPALMTCAPDPTAPTDTTQRPRAAVPWTFEDDAAQVAVTGLATCEPYDRGSGALRCLGKARVSKSAARLRLRFAAGRGLTWAGSFATVAPPTLADEAEVFVDYIDAHHKVCPYCGAYDSSELVIREGEGGKILWIGRQGVRQPDVDEGTVWAVFGVGAVKRPGCPERFQAGCSEVERTPFDHVIETSPMQVVRRGKLEEIATPHGRFQVLWAASDERIGRTSCADGPGVAQDRAFSASLLP